MINITLPWPPSVNTYWRNVYGRTLISRKGREYRRAVIAEIIAQKAAKALSGPLSISIGAHPPDKRRRDLDNILKALLDGLQHAGVMEDDNQIEELYICRYPPTDGGGIQIQIMKAKAQATA